MGCVNSKQLGSSDESSQSRKIDVYLRKERQVQESEVKLLLLGAGESGKTTITKQMKIIHMNGYSPEELLSQRETIYSNVLQSMQVLANAVETLDLKSLLLEENKESFETFKSDELPTRHQLTKEMGEKIKQLWKDPAIQQAYERNNEFQLIDSASYFFENLDRICEENYCPTEDDLLRARVITSGIRELSFNHGGVRWRVVDVGGQRNERKKWIHCFQDVTSLLFCVAMSEYDKKLFEDELVNRMHESLALFDEICNCQWFYDTSVMLFLNKSDLFREKIARVDMKCCFENYTGGCDYENGVKFLKKKFTGLNPNRQKPIYVHVTCATDTNNMRYVFNAVKDIVVSQSLLF